MRCVGCLNPAKDYPEIQDSMNFVREKTKLLQQKGIRIEIPVEQRYWEYGSALAVFLEHTMLWPRMGGPTVLNVGGGWDALTPVLAYTAGVYVTECEPDEQCRRDREKLVDLIKADGRVGSVTLLPNDIAHLPSIKFDFVYCISVLEHVWNELNAWEDLANRVSDGGVLFVTVDCVEDVSKPYFCDNVRQTKYSPAMLRDRVEMVKRLGFQTIGEPDYEWHGAQVYDYTFFRAGFRKDAA